MIWWVDPQNRMANPTRGPLRPLRSHGTALKSGLYTVAALLSIVLLLRILCFLGADI